MILNMRYRFEAAHRLPQHRGMCRFLHGHSYGLRVSLEVVVNPETGMGCDFADVDEVVQEKILARADHKNLNDFIENPTAEMISIWVWEQLEGALPGRLVEIEVHETTDCSCVYRGPGPGGE